MELTDEQFSLIKEQFKTLKERSPFYAKKFEGIDLSDVQTQEDFEKLPFSEKADLREAYPLGLAAVPEEKIVRIHSSSGTTGIPVVIPYTQKDVDDWATMFSRCYETVGITNKDRHRLPAWCRKAGRHGGSAGSGQHRKAAAHDGRYAVYCSVCYLLLCSASC